jgi:hypothetical protein
VSLYVNLNDEALILQLMIFNYWFEIAVFLIIHNHILLSKANFIKAYFFATLAVSGFSLRAIKLMVADLVTLAQLTSESVWVGDAEIQQSWRLSYKILA